MPSAYPPLDEQRLIVRFLDWHGAMTGRLIRAKKRLICLLNEQKQSIIHRAVTRGVDPDAKLKPTNIDWLGNVPAGWEVVALKYHYHQCLGKMLDTKTISGSNLVPYLRNTDVQWDGINVHNLPQMDITPSEIDRYTVKTGDILVCEGGDVGRAALWTHSLEPCGFQKALHRLRPCDEARDDPHFMVLQLRAAASRGAFSEYGKSTISHLTGEQLRRHRFVFPSMSDQLKIVEFVAVQSSSFDLTISKLRDEISLIQEFRTRLIADAVTGQLDVRAVTSTLPDLSDEIFAAEPMDEAYEEVGDTAEDEELAA
jgi:type I restriction enzyme S subunit